MLTTRLTFIPLRRPPKLVRSKRLPSDDDGVADAPTMLMRALLLRLRRLPVDAPLSDDETSDEAELSSGTAAKVVESEERGTPARLSSSSREFGPVRPSS